MTATGQIVKSFVPPVLTALYRKMRRPAWGYAGDYGSFEDARQRATGYDAPEIAERVLAATRKVLAGQAVFERDSVLFQHEECNYPLLFALYRAAFATGRLHVLDFGGALGSTFRQHVKHLRPVIGDISWHVVEQPRFVEASEALAHEKELHFHRSIAEVPADARIDVVLFSSVLQYLENPLEILGRVGGIRYLIIDRHPEFCERKQAQFTVQHVSKPIYEASYPLRVWGRGELKDFLGKNYLLLDEWESGADCRQVLKEKNGRKNLVRDIGMFFEKK